jgi:multicomponent Na+:H+ antiporter subunit D
MAVGQWDFKRLLAYHSISQMGYVVLAIGVAAALAARGGDAAVVGLALFGGLFHLVNHAVFKSLLFMSSGSVEQATGTRQLKDLGGVSARMPVTGACCRIAALSISGVPPLNGFWSKLVIVLALVLAGYYVLAAATVLVSFMTLLSFAKVQRYVLSGRPSERTAAAREAPAGMCVASVGLAVLCFATALVMLDDVRGVVVGPAVEDLTAWAAPTPPAVEVADSETPPTATDAPDVAGAEAVPPAEAHRAARAPDAEAVALADPSPPSPAGADPEEADLP